MTLLYFQELYIVLFYRSPRLHAPLVSLLAILALPTLTSPALQRQADAAAAEAETRPA
jgi:hypothetical protein